MNKKTKQNISYVIHPKKLFLIDGLGGLLTASLLFLLLGNFESCFGMPQPVLHALTFIAIFYALYSFSCHFLIKSNWAPFLYVIAAANSLYCILTSILLYCYYAELTGFGLLYFLSEIIVILVLVYTELKVANQKRCITQK